MKKYKFEITETLQKQVEIEADSFDEAYRKLKKSYRNEEIVLDSNDYIDTEFKLIPTNPLEILSRKSNSKEKER